jgi:sugar lactone lactonase YvrE
MIWLAMDGSDSATETVDAIENETGVVSIAADGTGEVVAEGMMRPNGIIFEAEGNLYVVAGAVGMGGRIGMVLRFDGIAAPA